MTDDEYVPRHHVSPENAKAFVEGVLRGNGVLPTEATIVADCLGIFNVIVAHFRELTTD